MDDANTLTAPADKPTDLQRLDANLTSLRVVERTIHTMAAYLTEARDRIAASPGDPEAQRAVRMAGLQMRGDALALGQQFTALAQPVRVER